MPRSALVPTKAQSLESGFLMLKQKDLNINKRIELKKIYGNIFSPCIVDNNAAIHGADSELQIIN